MRVTNYTLGRNSYNIYKMFGARGMFGSPSGMGSMLDSLGDRQNSNMANLAADFSAIRNGRTALRDYYTSIYGRKHVGKTEKSPHMDPSNRRNRLNDQDLLGRIAGSYGATGSTLADRVKVGKAADDMTKAAEKLTTTDAKKSVFEPSKDGSYDMDAIVSGVQDFVKNYNALKDTVVKNGDSKALQKELDVVSTSKALSRPLSNVGITINKDNSLSLDVEKLKGANVDDIKSIFNGKGSYAENVKQNASQIKSNVITNTGATFSGYNGGRGSVINMLV